ncbi:hypothetical protein I3843_12G087800 [Carya illinoinensis]|uniref:Late embryogenesis abundant protein LEA-2 subgroup domain-containing protein n=1 Tax=Carya illinoinensis TaxID=32201 RepID=A0A8T1NV13_CARIL|nr:uncharacterized protein LOC122289072 [Carya illinoinensis]KAG2677149.1 hypothetical protein I3760_12G085600 [Carya illinoinensis]KAG6633998.1 hypothetical protein CIPAW_12G088200 [Carya illinoinensis]KAG6684911.1 hypothetical protein I3842_12G087000 [Carya illinoinensis]KAG7952988.1 hypothetical protein I3843_12G087800 [Carya illinoinensis]
MAEKTNYQPAYPLAPANGYPRSDEESANPDELRRKKRIKLAIYIAIFVVFQAIVIAVFAVTVMKVKTPKVRLGSDVMFQNVSTSTQPSASFDISFTTQVRVKNTNFGPYKYDSATATFVYDGVTVGEVSIPKGKAGMLSTKKVSVTVNVNSNTLQSTSNLGSELSGGFLTLTSHAKLSGKVELMFVMKKKKSAEMNCTMKINVSPNHELRELICK